MGHLWISGDIFILITGKEVVWAEAKNDADAKYPAMHSLSSPTENYLTQTIWSRDWETLLQSTPASDSDPKNWDQLHILFVNRLKKMKSMSITVIYDYLPGYPPKMQSTGACSERDCDGSQATANCLSLVVMLLSGFFSAFLFLLFDESALSLESLTYTVVTALLFTEWAWVCGRQNRGSKDVNILIPGMRECVTLPGQERITDVIKSRILRWDSPRLSK